ncbi:MAG TPA: hypothetical protein PK819_13875 [Thermomicrobiales bacterium]|nr:hypothetical protein [Thermomicrobiales bacterium]
MFIGNTATDLQVLRLQNNERLNNAARLNTLTRTETTRPEQVSQARRVICRLTVFGTRRHLAPQY